MPQPAPNIEHAHKAEILDGIELAMDSLVELSKRQIDAIRRSDFERAERLNEQMMGILDRRSSLIRRFIALIRKPN